MHRHTDELCFEKRKKFVEDIVCELNIFDIVHMFVWNSQSTSLSLSVHIFYFPIYAKGCIYVEVVSNDINISIFIERL